MKHGRQNTIPFGVDAHKIKVNARFLKERTGLQLYKRVELHGTAVVHDSKTVVVMEIVNMSESGIFLSKGKSGMFSPGKQVSLTLKGPQFPEPIHAKGKVVRLQASPNGVAIEFTSLSRRARLQLQASVEEISVESFLNELGR